MFMTLFYAYMRFEDVLKCFEAYGYLVTMFENDLRYF